MGRTQGACEEDFRPRGTVCHRGESRHRLVGTTASKALHRAALARRSAANFDVQQSKMISKEGEMPRGSPLRPWKTTVPAQFRCAPQSLVPPGAIAYPSHPDLVLGSSHMGSLGCPRGFALQGCTLLTRGLFYSLWGCAVMVCLVNVDPCWFPRSCWFTLWIHVRGFLLSSDFSLM